MSLDRFLPRHVYGSLDFSRDDDFVFVVLVAPFHRWGFQTTSCMVHQHRTSKFIASCVVIIVVRLARSDNINAIQRYLYVSRLPLYKVEDLQQNDREYRPDRVYQSI